MSSQDTSFARLVSLACHDLRTPLATVHGFARTIERTQELEDPLARYLEMIGAAALQMTDLLETLSAAARIEGGRYEPVPAEADTLDLARAAAAKVDGASAEGNGVTLTTDVGGVERALAAFASCAVRHGAAPAVSLRVDGTSIVVAPVNDGAARVILGEDLKDLGAAVAVRIVRALGGSAELDGASLVVSLSTL
jgi:signal transduction histidine kinase